MKNNLHEKPYSTTFEVDPALAQAKDPALESEFICATRIYELNFTH